MTIRIVRLPNGEFWNAVVQTPTANAMHLLHHGQPAPVVLLTKLSLRDKWKAHKEILRSQTP